MTLDPREFLNTVSGAANSARERENTSADRPIRIATVDPAYATGNARVTFEGEDALTGKAYPWANYQPVAGQRVVMFPVGNTYVIMGAIGVAPAGGGGGGVTDHGALTGLADDDHTQYHTDTRGDARYYTKAVVDSGLAGKANTVHNHAAADINSGTLGVPRGGTGLVSVTSGNFLTGNGTGALNSRTPAQVKTDIGASLGTYRDEFANVKPTATNTWELWGQNAGYTNPGRTCVVMASFVGRFRYLGATAARYNGGCRLDISLDGGSNFTNGKALFTEVRGSDSPAASLLANMNLVGGLPTGTIVVRVMFQIAAGGSPVLISTDFMDAAIQTLVVPV